MGNILIEIYLHILLYNIFGVKARKKADLLGCSYIIVQNAKKNGSMLCINADCDIDLFGEMWYNSVGAKEKF